MRKVTIERPSSRPPTVKSLPAPPTHRRLFGLATRRQRWGPSWKGWLIIALLVIGIAGSLTYAAYPFLAVTHRVNADTLVVEGWVHRLLPDRDYGAEYWLMAATKPQPAGD